MYRLFPEANVVLHVHTVNATVLSRIEKSDTLALQGYEMQKTLSGQHSHLDTVPIAIFDNDQILTPWRRGLPIMRKRARCATAFCCAATA